MRDSVPNPLALPVLAMLLIPGTISGRWDEDRMIGKLRILDDMAALAGGAVSLASAARQQIRQELRSRTDSLASRLDLVPREDFERLESLLVRARQEQESLKKRLDALEGAKETKTKGEKEGKPSSPRKKSA